MVLQGNHNGSSSFGDGHQPYLGSSALPLPARRIVLEYIDENWQGAMALYISSTVISDMNARGKFHVSESIYCITERGPYWLSRMAN
jgi:hypothetical protein